MKVKLSQAVKMFFGNSSLEMVYFEAIANAWDVYKPQMADYVTRALKPDAAPSYGVPGDE